MTDKLKAPILWGKHWQHRKGGEYTAIATGLIEATLTPCVIYQADHDGAMVWIRPYDEFTDGRFTCIDAAPPLSPPAQDIPDEH